MGIINMMIVTYSDDITKCNAFPGYSEAFFWGVILVKPFPLQRHFITGVATTLIKTTKVETRDTDVPLT